MQNPMFSILQDALDEQIFGAKRPETPAIELSAEIGQTITELSEKHGFTPPEVIQIHLKRLENSSVCYTLDDILSIKAAEREKLKALAKERDEQLHCCHEASNSIYECLLSAAKGLETPASGDPDKYLWELKAVKDMVNAALTEAINRAA